MVDKLIAIENIKILAKRKKIPMADVESAARVSTGYFARLTSDIVKSRSTPPQPGENPSERALAPADVMERAAEKLGVTLDSLLNIRYKDMTDSEGALVIFIDSLAKATNRGNLVWGREDPEVVFDGKPYGEFQNHPLCAKRGFFATDLTDNGEEISQDTYAYFSQAMNRFFDAYDYIYVLKHKGKTFMLTEIGENTDPYVHEAPTFYYELYEIEKTKLVCIASASDTPDSSRTASPIYIAMGELYKAAKKSASINPNGDNIVKLVNEYMDFFDFKNESDDDNEEEGGE